MSVYLVNDAQHGCWRAAGIGVSGTDSLHGVSGGRHWVLTRETKASASSQGRGNGHGDGQNADESVSRMDPDETGYVL